MGTPIFGPIPTRAFADKDLRGEDFRVLGIIAAHDRLGANRTGCYASQATLCFKIGIDTTAFSRSIHRLGERGYLTASTHPLNKRLRAYSVVYTDDDDIVMTAREDT